MVSKRFAEANNPHCLDYDNSKPDSLHLYLDANNLYGWAMNQFLSLGEFQWVYLRPRQAQGSGHWY